MFHELHLEEVSYNWLERLTASAQWFWSSTMRNNDGSLTRRSIYRGFGAFLLVNRFSRNDGGIISPRRRIRYSGLYRGGMRSSGVSRRRIDD